MKKFFLLMALCCMSVFSAKAAEVYVVFDGDHTLTYYYDDNRASWDLVGFTTELYNEPYKKPFHYGYNDKVKVAVIDESMKNADLTSMRFFFGGPNGDDTYLSALTTIYGMENLNTANVTDMACMFYGCKSLTTVDLSGFNTAKVTDMYSMFLDCTSLSEIDLSSFNTALVTDMSRMFLDCKSLTSLDLTSFDINNVSDASYMFDGCSALTTIYCNDDWSQSEELTKSTYMFAKCNSLVGGRGTERNSFVLDKTYARPDGGAEAPGYFTLKKEVYTVFDGETLTYYYDDNYIDREGIVEMYDIANTRFVGYNDQIKKAVIDESMKNANLTSTRMMFYGGDGGYYLPALTEIEGLQNLNTANVTDMSIMFGACQALEIVDISGFDFSSVTNASAMFMLCTALTTIYCDEDLNNYSALNNSLLMFYNCTSLVGGEGTEFDANHQDKAYARPDGGAEAPGYFTRKKEVYTVFDRSGTLTYYYDDRAEEREGIVEKYLVRKTQVRFDGYNELVKKAVIDESMNEADLNWMGDLFYGGNNTHALINMTDIEGLENLNTSNVSYMGGMFLNCSSLTTLDIRSFEFNFRPTGVTQMFSYCRNLETIYCNVDLTDMYEGNAEYMFLGCDKLKGGNGTRYDADHTNNSYARPDKPGQPGYFTELIDPCAVPTDVRLASEVRREDMIELAWTPGKEGQTGWGFRYKKSSERTYTEYYSRALNSGSSNPSMQIWGLEPGTEYDFVVFAICGEDISSNEDISDDSEPFTASTLMPEGVESIQTSVISGQKMLRDGQLFIESNGKIYNAQGAEVK